MTVWTKGAARKPCRWKRSIFAFMRPFSVTPPGRFSRSMTLAALVWRAGAAFFAWAALPAGLATVGAVWGRRLATRAFVVAVAGSFLVCSVGIEVVIFIGLLWAAVAASRHSSLLAPTHAREFWRAYWRRRRD